MGGNDQWFSKQIYFFQFSKVSQFIWRSWSWVLFSWSFSVSSVKVSLSRSFHVPANSRVLSFDLNWRSILLRTFVISFNLSVDSCWICLIRLLRSFFLHPYFLQKYEIFHLQNSARALWFAQIDVIWLCEYKIVVSDGGVMSAMIAFWMGQSLYFQIGNDTSCL